MRQATLPVSDQHSKASEEINRTLAAIDRHSAEAASILDASAQAMAELAQQAHSLKAIIEEMHSS